MRDAEAAFRKSVVFTPADAKPDANRHQWVQQIGVYYYYSLVLAGFDPVRADRIFDSRADQIAVAYVSKMAYEYVKRSD